MGALVHLCVPGVFVTLDGYELELFSGLKLGTLKLAIWKPWDEALKPNNRIEASHGCQVWIWWNIFPNFHGVFFGVHSLKESKALWGVSFNDGFVAGQRTKPAQGVATVAAGTMETCGDGDSSQQRSSRLRQSTWNVLLNMRSNSMTDCEGGGKVCPKSFQSFGSCKSLEAVFCCFMASIFFHQWPSNSFDMLFFSSVVRLWFVWGPDRARSIVGCCRALSSCHFVWIENTATLCHDWGVHILNLISL